MKKSAANIYNDVRMEDRTIATGVHSQPTVWLPRKTRRKSLGLVWSIMSKEKNCSNKYFKFFYFFLFLGMGTLVGAWWWSGDVLVGNWPDFEVKFHRYFIYFLYLNAIFPKITVIDGTAHVSCQSSHSNQWKKKNSFHEFKAVTAALET
jgi:hypothetical protein